MKRAVNGGIGGGDRLKASQLEEGFYQKTRGVIW